MMTAWQMANGKWQRGVRFVICLLPSAMLLAGCNKNPFDRTRDASNGGATGSFSGNFVIFNNELISGGGAFEYPGSEGQSLSFNDTSNPVSRRSIRYSWTGEAVANQTVFAGFDLMYTATQGEYGATPGRDLRKAGYTRVTFYARGALSTATELKIEVSDDGNTATATPCLVLSTNGTDPNNLCDANGPDPLKMPPLQLTSSWMQYTIMVPQSALANIKDFFKATFVFTNPSPGSQAPGQGGIAYFDVIQYQP